MIRIKLTDNNIGSDGNIYGRKDVAELFPVASKDIYELCKDNENLLVFPYSLEDSDDRIGCSTILNIQNTGNPDEVRIETGNVMGFIGVGNLQIKIQSRFDEGREDYLLHYMLQKVMPFNLFDFKHHNEEEAVFDFMMFMFPCFLKSALRHGLYREYRTFKYNDAALCGSVELRRHLSHNIPFVGNIAYVTREYSYDNDISQLIRHTIEFMMSKECGNAALNINRETIENVKEIIFQTPSYNKEERARIINRNLRFKCHPYYMNYKPLQSLCLQILRMEEVKYGENEDELCGILFDGAWLWEEYVNTLLSGLGFVHPRNKLGKGGIYLFEDVDTEGRIHKSGIRYPDFYKRDFVLDAKYKRLGSYDKVSKVGADDVHQVITYMKNLGATKGGFISPLEKVREKLPISHLRNSDSTLSIFGIEICREATSYSDFCQQMKKNEQLFIQSLL